MAVSGDDITKSLFSLAKYNNGYFKSDKQRDFLLKMRNDGNAFIGGHNDIYGNSFFYVFHLDDLGVKKITRETKGGEKTSGKSVVTFERQSDADYQKKQQF